MSDLAKRIADLSPEQHQTLLRKLQEMRDGHSSQSIRPRSGAPHFLPLSFAQQRLWFLSQLEPDNPVYLLPFAVHISGQLNKAALQASIQQVVRRHESLRTCFVIKHEQPCQVIMPEVSLEL